MINRFTVYCELVAKQDGQYVQYVFKNLDEPQDSWDRYIMVTRCPNWQCSEEMNIGKVGYLTFEPVDAGNSYFNANTGTNEQYKHTAYYFIDFVEEKTEINIKDFKF